MGKIARRRVLGTTAALAAPLAAWPGLAPAQAPPFPSRPI